MEKNAITITHKEVQKLLNIKESAAKQHLSTLRSALKKKRFQKIFLLEFCEFENLDYKYAKQILTA